MPAYVVYGHRPCVRCDTASGMREAFRPEATRRAHAASENETAVMSQRDAFERILAALIDTIRSGVIQLDRRGRIVAANELARDLLRRGDGLSDQGGSLHARAPADDAALQALLARALPGFGSQGPGGSILVRRGLGPPPLVLHVSPVDAGGTEIDAEHVAALVLVVDPASRTRIDPALVAATLGLTPMESRLRQSWSCLPSACWHHPGTSRPGR